LLQIFFTSGNIKNNSENIASLEISDSLYFSPKIYKSLSTFPIMSIENIFLKKALCLILQDL